jgi:hypothetical protein
VSIENGETEAAKQIAGEILDIGIELLAAIQIGSELKGII